MRKIEDIVAIIALVLLVVLILIVQVLAFMFAWNIAIADLLGGPTIEWYHAIAILILISSITGFIGKGPSK